MVEIEVEVKNKTRSVGKVLMATMSCHNKSLVLTIKNSSWLSCWRQQLAKECTEGSWEVKSSSREH